MPHYGGTRYSLRYAPVATATPFIDKTSLIAYWKLDEASGTRNDSHGSNHLTDNNTVTQTTGKLNNAAQFTSANQESLSIDHNADLAGGDRDWAWTFWVKFDTLGAVRTLIGKWGPTNYDYLVQYDNATQRIHHYLRSGGSTVGAACDNFGAPTAGVWLFIYAYYDATNNLIGISVNDGIHNTTSHSGGSNNNSGVAIHLGRNVDASTYHNGQLDGVARWNRLLTAQEVTNLYNSGNGLDYS